MEFVDYEGEGEPDGPGGFVRLVGKFSACRRLVRTTPEDGYSFGATVTVDPDPDTGRLKAVHVAVGSEAQPITSALLRLVRVQEFVLYAGTAVVWEGPAIEPGYKQSIAGPRLLSSERQYIMDNGFDDVALGFLARIYQHALIVEGTPTKLVEEVFRVTRPMARHWIKTARERGYLGASEGRGRAGV